MGNEHLLKEYYGLRGGKEERSCEKTAVIRHSSNSLHLRLLREGAEGGIFPINLRTGDNPQSQGHIFWLTNYSSTGRNQGGKKGNRGENEEGAIGRNRVSVKYNSHFE